MEWNVEIHRFSIYFCYLRITTEKRIFDNAKIRQSFTIKYYFIDNKCEFTITTTIFMIINQIIKCY